MDGCEAAGPDGRLRDGHDGGCRLDAFRNPVRVFDPRDFSMPQPGPSKGLGTSAIQLWEGAGVFFGISRATPSKLRP